MTGEVSNARGTCPSLQFTLNGYLVKTSAATVYTKGTCMDVKNDRDITVRGDVVAIKTVSATAVEVKK